MGLDNPIHIAFLLILLLLVFGAKRLPEMGRSLGDGMRGFKDAISGEGTHTRTQPPAAASRLSRRWSHSSRSPSRQRSGADGAGGTAGEGEAPRLAEGFTRLTRRRSSTNRTGRVERSWQSLLAASDIEDRVSVVDHLEELRARLIVRWP